VPVALDVHFVILIHPLEVKRRVATGRMAHLCLSESTLIEGFDFSGNARVGGFVADPRNHCVVLYPGPRSVNLSRLSDEGRVALTPPGRRLVVFVIDGTWNTAGRMIRNEHLGGLPTLSFDPGEPSRFRVRKQPKPECLSTIEAIHRTIDLLRPNDVARTRAHDNMLSVFDYLVDYQLLFENSKR
jgi:DTW domain-containing protein YfiP